METSRKYSWRMLLLELITVLVALMFLVPFYFVIVNSLKKFADILKDSAALPKAVTFDNFTRAWEILEFPKAFTNSLVITVLANVLLALFCSMAAYRLVRHPSRFNNIVFMAFVAAMVIPFQSIMIPLVRVAANLGLTNNLPGLIICYLGFGASLTIFLFHGFVKSVPIEVEEAGIVDGCSPFGVFFRIVVPLLKPMIVTVFILNTLWIWNDFLLPLLIVGGNADLRTIPLATNAFFSQYTKQWDLALAGLLMGITPIIIFFLALQKHIIAGIAAGAVKG